MSLIDKIFGSYSKKELLVLNLSSRQSLTLTKSIQSFPKLNSRARHSSLKTDSKQARHWMIFFLKLLLHAVKLHSVYSERSLSRYRSSVPSFCIRAESLR